MRFAIGDATADIIVDIVSRPISAASVAARSAHTARASSRFSSTRPSETRGRIW